MKFSNLSILLLILQIIEDGTHILFSAPTLLMFWGICYYTCCACYCDGALIVKFAYRKCEILEKKVDNDSACYVKQNTDARAHRFF